MSKTEVKIYGLDDEDLDKFSSFCHKFDIKYGKGIKLLLALAEKNELLLKLSDELSIINQAIADINVRLTILENKKEEPKVENKSIKTFGGEKPCQS